MKQFKPILRTILSGLFCAALMTTTNLSAQNTSVTFSTAGSQTWTVPQGVSSVTIETWGAGGGGGGAESHILNYTKPRGGAGGGGAYASTTLSVVPNDQIDMIIGQGGQGGVSAADGANGEASSVSFAGNTIASADGGQGGAFRDQDNTGTATGLGGNGGLNFLFAGGNGGPANTTDNGAGGGGAGGSTANGEDGTATTTGLGGSVGGGNGGDPTTAQDQNGNNGIIPGGGGGGASRTDLAGSSNGGNGANGMVKISFCKLPDAPLSITGNTTMCEGEVLNYSATSDDASVTSYIWTFPAGWTGSGISDQITVVAGAQSGNITIKAVNECGNSVETILAVTATPIPAQPSFITGNTTVCEGDTVNYSVVNDATVDSYEWTIPAEWAGSSTTNAIDATVLSTGIISVKSENACGTSPARSVSVTMNSIPAQPSAIVGVASICQGETANYSVTNDPTATAYVWTLPASWTGSSTTNSLDATVGATSGDITVAAANTCGVSTATVITVAVNPIDNGITRNGNTLSATQVGATYIWLDCATGNPIEGATAQTYTPTVNGEYKVLVFTAEGCSATSDCMLINDLSVEKINLNNVTVYPNPATDKVTISNLPAHANVQLMDMTGKTIASYSASSSIELNVQSVKPGVYMIVIESSKGTTTQKLVVR